MNKQEANDAAKELGEGWEVTITGYTQGMADYGARKGSMSVESEADLMSYLEAYCDNCDKRVPSIDYLHYIGPEMGAEGHLCSECMGGELTDAERDDMITAAEYRGEGDR